MTPTAGKSTYQQDINVELFHAYSKIYILSLKQPARSFTLSNSRIRRGAESYEINKTIQTVQVEK